MTREEAMDIFEHNWTRLVNPDFTEEELNKAIGMAVKALEQEPKTGHWILDETDHSITCNKCGCLMWASDLCFGDAHYCPNCGARMESEDKE